MYVGYIDIPLQTTAIELHYFGEALTTNFGLLYKNRFFLNYNCLCISELKMNIPVDRIGTDVSSGEKG